MSTPRFYVRNPPKGEKHYCAKLTEEAVRYARDRFKAGESKASLARLLGVTDTVMGRAINGVTWKHVGRSA